MVVKQLELNKQKLTGFESSVISYGSKTLYFFYKIILLFESSVISYGSKTLTYLL